jgi:hypothetical protein
MTKTQPNSRRRVRRVSTSKGARSCSRQPSAPFPVSELPSRNQFSRCWLSDQSISDSRCARPRRRRSRLGAPSALGEIPSASNPPEGCRASLVRISRLSQGCRSHIFTQALFLLAGGSASCVARPIMREMGGLNVVLRPRDDGASARWTDAVTGQPRGTS